MPSRESDRAAGGKVGRKVRKRSERGQGSLFRSGVGARKNLQKSGGWRRNRNKVSCPIPDPWRRHSLGLHFVFVSGGLHRLRSRLKCINTTSRTAACSG